MYVKKPKPASQMPNSSSLGKKTDTIVYIKLEHHCQYEF